MYPRLLFAFVSAFSLATSFLTAPSAFCGAPDGAFSSRNVGTSQPDPFEISVGYNYINLGDAYPETKNLHGFDVSAFWNARSWLSLGGDFMGDFGTKTYHFFNGNVDVDSTRYIYVFGPRFTVWQNPRLRVFVEALAGGVHAEVKASLGSVSRTLASDDAFAAAAGAGIDWKFAQHFSWRIVQADYLPTNLGSQWQNNFRASTAIVYSFGGR